MAHIPAGTVRDPSSGALIFPVDPIERRINELVKRLDEIVRRIDALEQQSTRKE
jgi:hypothetical protein